MTSTRDGTRRSCSTSSPVSAAAAHELANLFRRVDEFRQEQRARKLEDTVERSRRVPRPADAGRENPGDEERKEW